MFFVKCSKRFGHMKSHKKYFKQFKKKGEKIKYDNNLELLLNNVQ